MLLAIPGREPDEIAELLELFDESLLTRTEESMDDHTGTWTRRKVLHWRSGLTTIASMEHPDAIAVVSTPFVYAKEFSCQLEPYTVAVLEIRYELAD